MLCRALDGPGAAGVPRRVMDWRFQQWFGQGRYVEADFVNTTHLTNGDQGCMVVFMTNPRQIEGQDCISLSQFSSMLGVSRQAMSDWLVSGIMAGVVRSIEVGELRSVRHFVPQAFAVFATKRLARRGCQAGMGIELFNVVKEWRAKCRSSS